MEEERLCIMSMLVLWYFVEVISDFPFPTEDVMAVKWMYLAYLGKENNNGFNSMRILN